MAEINKTQGRTVVDYMARDYDSFLESMRSLVPDKLPEWNGHSAEADFGNVLLQLFAHMGDMLSYYQDRVVNESFLGTAQTRRSIIEHLRLVSYRLSTAAPAAAALQISVPAAFTGTVTVRRGSAFATKSQKNRASVRFEYLGPDFDIDGTDPALTIDASSGRKLYPLPLPVEEGRTIRDELLGISDGSPNQRFTLAHPQLILRSEGLAAGINRDVMLRTELGTLIQEWTQQDTLAFSRAGLNEFSIEIDADDCATIILGDDQFGAIPPAGTRLIATYRVGGGSQGNVAAHTIRTVVEAPALALAGAQVTNLLPATGGAERESIEHAVAHAPAVFRSLKRAVTSADYEALALKYKGVGKVRAEHRNWNTVTLYVAPEGGGQVSDILRANLIAYFDDKRPISTVVEVEDVDYVGIYVTAEVEIESYYSIADIKEKVEQAAGGLLAFDKVGFRQEIYLSKFYEAIEAIDGVKFVTVTEFRRVMPPGRPPDPPGKITLDVNEIPKAPDAPGEALYASGIQAIVRGGY